MTERPTPVGLFTVTLTTPTAADVWDQARWDRAHWDGAAAAAVDVTADVAGFTVRTGRDGPTGHARPTELALELNNETGRYTPWWDTAQHRRRWWLGAPIRVATADGPLFTGYVSKVSELDAPIAAHNRSVLLAGTGPLGHLANADDVEQPSQGGGETAGPRLNRIMDHARLPSWVPRQLDPGMYGLQPTTLAKSALEECWLTADSDGGAIFELPDGTIRYVFPATFDNDPRYTQPVVTFGDGYPGTEVMIESFTTELSTDPVYNRVQIALVGGQVKTAENLADEWAGLSTFSRTDLIHATDAWSQELATMTLERLSNRELQISPLTYDPLYDAASWDAAHRLRPYDRVRVLRWRDGHKLDLAATVDQITHQVNAEAWTSIVTLSPGSQDFDYTRWDVARWNHDRWE